jgi:glycerophosphoryl diester phosphodiesterase
VSKTFKVIGHRCRVYDRDVTVENTLEALEHVSRLRPRAWCEIDAWRIADGTLVVWHDATWTRVSDPATRPGDLPDRVAQATWQQVKKVRTRGGAKVPTLRKMIRRSGELGVQLVIEVKNGLPEPQRWTSFAAEQGARVRWYQAPSPTSCRLASIDALAELGAVTGVKTDTTGACPMTPEEVAGHGSFVAEDTVRITAEVVEEYAAVGVQVWPKRSNKSSWTRMLEAGVTRLIVPNPRQALRWQAMQQEDERE